MDVLNTMRKIDLIGNIYFKYLIKSQYLNLDHNQKE